MEKAFEDLVLGDDVVVISKENKEALKGFSKIKRINQIRETALNVSKLLIYSAASSICIRTVKKNTLTVFLHGTSNCDVHVKIKNDADALKIFTVFDKDYFSGEMYLDVYVPEYMIETAYVKAKVGDITFIEGANIKEIYASTLKGNVELRSAFSYAKLKTLLGNITVNSQAISDIAINAISIGNIKIQLQNAIYTSTCTVNGSFTNEYAPSKNAYRANIFAKTYGGNIVLK